MESANAAARQRRKAQERREQGQPPRNGTRCFGYDLHYQHVVPEEAAIIREARDRLFAGETLYGVTRDFQKRGVLSPSGRPWRTDSFKQRLLSPTLAAIREFDGKTHPGTWPAIISPDDNRRLRLLLSRRPGSPRTSPARNYLLGGFLRCARCGGLLRGHLVAGDEGRRARYICITIVGTNNCARLSIKAEPLDEMVREAVIAAVDDAALRDALGARGQRDAGLLEAIRQDEAAQELLSHDFYVERVISREEYLSARRELMRRLEGNRAMLAKRTGANLLGSYLGDGEALRQAWEHGSLDWQRAVIGALIEHITILPGLPGRKPFDPNRVQPVWRY